MNVPGLLADRVACGPDMLAVTDGEHELSVAALGARVRQIARALRAHGAGPGRAVVVALPSCADLVAAWLGVLAAGAVCVPADPGAPDRWAALCAGATEPACVLTASVAARGWRWPGADPLLVDELGLLDEAGLPDADRGDAAPRADATAFVQAGSAGAGAPVGVALTHRTLDAAIAASLALHPGPGMVGGWIDPSADPAPAALFAALAAGATIVLGRPAEAAASGLRPDLLRIPADDLRQLSLLPADASPIAELVLYGDLGPGPALGHWRLRHRAVTVTKEYCWPETAGPCAYLRLEPGRAAADRPAIGTAVPGASITLLDDDGHRVADGRVGEAFIGGDLVASGYPGRPDLTAQRFPADPGRPGARLFRTGDLMRRRADGTLELVGRRDRQVRLRGVPADPCDVEAALLCHPGVAHAEAGIDAESLTVTAQVVLAGGYAGWHAAAVAEREVIGRWREVYDSLYTGPARPPGEDFSGWASSYDGLDIPEDQMREWRRATVRRIQSLRPRRLLEIGVGTGLLLSQLAAECEEYWATDLSEAALDRVAAWTARDGGPRVVLRHQAADELAGLPARYFDTVVLNSVIQYFPGERYLARVIAGICELLVPGGAIFLGDVRNLRLDRCLRTAVRLTRGIARDQVPDAELLVDPEYFAAWAAAAPGGRSADIRVKRGTFHNELTRHRYDVILRPGRAPDPDPRRADELGWDACAGPHGLSRLLSAAARGQVLIRGIPNGRLAGELAALRAVESGQDPAAARRLLDAAPAGPDPEELCALGESRGFRPLPTWSGASADGAVDILFQPPRAAAGIAPYRPDPAGGWPLTSRPAMARAAAGPIAEILRQHARAHLPQHLVPASITVVGDLVLASSSP